jgi:hypothetical protein
MFRVRPSSLEFFEALISDIIPHEGQSDLIR